MLKPAVKRKVVSTNSGQLWPEAHEWLVNGRVTPFISNYLTAALFNADAANLAQAWASEVGSPLGEAINRDLAHVAQFYSIQAKSRLQAKSHYLDALINYLLGMIEEDATTDQELQEVIGALKTEFETTQRFSRSFSQVVRELGYPRYADVNQNPLRLLAELPLPIYITTGHHEFLELALTQTGRKQPVTEFFYWHDGLQGIPSIFDQEPDYKPTAKRPLVYHLHGLDRYPESLVLSEDDHLDLLVKLAELPHRVKLLENVRDIPAPIRMALSGTALLMLGYDIYSWEFRVLLRGLIKATGESRHNRNIPKGVCVQVDPHHHAQAAQASSPEPEVDDPEQAQARQRLRAYLQQYFDEIHFNVYWGSVEACVQELWQTYRGSTA